MLIYIDKETYQTRVFKEKSSCAEFLGVDRSTLYRRMKNGVYVGENYILSKPDFIQGKSLRGGKR
jgi:hypothetical protein